MKKGIFQAGASTNGIFGTASKRNGCFEIAGRMLLLFLLVITVAGCGNFSGTGNQKNGGADVGSSKDQGKLEVHFLDVGQGDATLIRQGDHAMLIDAGENDKGTQIQSYLQSQGIEHLDYVIGTHPDSDHVGGLDVVLYKFSWDQVILPDLNKDTRTYQDVLKVIKDKNKKITYPNVGDTYTLGNAEFTVLAPVGYDYGDNWNDYSVGIRLSFGENHFLFTGDAEEDAEEDMLEEGMELSADVMKAAHHGSDTANTEAFLEQVKPQAVVISCGEGNSYGHPRAEAMNHFRSIDAKIYRTDEQGTIVAASDGKQITWNCSPSESWQAGEPSGGQKEAEDSGEDSAVQKKDQGLSGEYQADDFSQGAEDSYVVNTNTKKFHLPSCNSVEQMDEENREYSGSSKEELLEEGYEPCKNCNP